MSTVGNRILNLRKAKKLSQEALANMAGISDTYVGKLEKNNANATAKVLDNIANALDTTVNYLMYGEEKTKEKIMKETINIDKDITTIAAHFEGEEFTKEDKYDIENFIKYVLSKKK